MADQVLLHLVALATFITGTSGWRCAKYEHYFSQQPDYIDCVWDCCGNSFNRHCCAPIGIIVGCAIVGAVVLAALVVLLLCWWQRRRSRQSQGPRLFHNRRHSHYPVAPASVTRPGPMSYGGPGPDPGYKPGPGYGPTKAGYRPQQEYRPVPAEKPPIDDFDDRSVPPPGGFRPGPPPGGYRPPPPGPPRNDRPPQHDERAVDI